MMAVMLLMLLVNLMMAVTEMMMSNMIMLLFSWQTVMTLKALKVIM